MQDQMLSRMLMAINLSAKDVFITNVIKCAVPGSCQPQATHVQSCVSYLRRQILALLPEVICTMGTVAARAVLQRSQPLSRLRGQFHEYEVGKEQTIPVIPTYHPTYLLQNPEMKQATWADLQLLAKRMGLKKAGH
jgi:DNA polymerase